MNMKKLILITLLLIPILLTGCSNVEPVCLETVTVEENKYYSDAEIRVMAVDNCIKKGGIPEISGWDGSVRDCVIK